MCSARLQTAYMQKVYRFVYGKTYRITKHVSETARSCCIFVCCLILCSGFFADRAGGINYIDRDMIFGSVMVFILSLLSIDREPGRIRWNKWAYPAMAAFGAGMLIIGKLHYVGVGYATYALDLMFIFPAFYYIQISTDSSERLYRMLSLSVLTCGVISYAYCWMLAAQGRLPDILPGRFFGYFDNPNSVGMAGVVVLIAGLYLLTGSRNKWIRAAAAIAAGIGTDYALKSASRSAVLCEMICIAAFLIFLYKRHRSGVRTGAGIKSVIVYILLAAAVIAAGTKIESVNLKAQQDGGASADLPVVLIVEAASEEAPLAERPGISDGMHDFTSGRTDIWKVYIDHFSWLGMDVRELMNWFGEGAAFRAHNNFIDYTVRCGYIVGFFYLVFYIAVGIRGLIILFSKKHITPEDFLLVSVIGAYSIQALVEVATLPFTRIIPCMFFLTIAPLMGRKDDTESADAIKE